jgi:hypothetical protein
MLVDSYCESLLSLHGLLDYSALYDVLGQGFVVFCNGHETIGQGSDWQLLLCTRIHLGVGCVLIVENDFISQYRVG